jgi:hypothetical protein
MKTILHVVNWGYYLESLRLVAERGPGQGKPYQSRH